MKKLILIIVAIIAMINISKAQENGIDSREILHLGLKIGTNYSNVYDAQADNFVANGKFGFVGGGFLAIPIGKYLGIQPELLFSQKGFKANGSTLGVDYDVTRTTNFIDVPILIALKPSKFVTILAGPQYSYLMKQTDEFNNSIWSSIHETDFQNTNLRKNIFCFLGGIDLNYNILVLSGRVGWDISNNNGDCTSTNPRYKNVWYQLTLGFKVF